MKFFSNLFCSQPMRCPQSLHYRTDGLSTAEKRSQFRRGRSDGPQLINVDRTVAIQTFLADRVIRAKPAMPVKALLEQECGASDPLLGLGNHLLPVRESR